MNSAALLDRMNFALSLVNNKIGRACSSTAAKLCPPARTATRTCEQAQLEQILLTGNISPQTHQTLSSTRSATLLGARSAASANAPPATQHEPVAVAARLAGVPTAMTRYNRFRM